MCHIRRIFTMGPRRYAGMTSLICSCDSLGDFQLPSSASMQQFDKFMRDCIPALTAPLQEDTPDKYPNATSALSANISTGGPSNSLEPACHCQHFRAIVTHTIAPEMRSYNLISGPLAFFMPIQGCSTSRISATFSQLLCSTYVAELVSDIEWRPGMC